MSSISEPFLYVHEMAGTAPSFHLLFMAIARGDRLTDETARVEETGSGDLSGSASADASPSRCARSMFHAHAPSLFGPWTVTKAAPSYSGNDDRTDGSPWYSRTTLPCQAFEEHAGKRDPPNPAISSSMHESGSENARGKPSDGNASSVVNERAETTFSFGRPYLMHMPNDQGYSEPIAFYALFEINKTGVRTQLNSGNAGTHHSDLEATVFGALCAHS